MSPFFIDLLLVQWNYKTINCNQGFLIYLLQVIHGGLVLIGKTAVLKTAGLTALGVRVPHPPLWRVGRVVMQRIANPSSIYSDA